MLGGADKEWCDLKGSGYCFLFNSFINSFIEIIHILQSLPVGSVQLSGF